MLLYVDMLCKFYDDVACIADYEIYCEIVFYSITVQLHSIAEPTTSMELILTVKFLH